VNLNILRILERGDSLIWFFVSVGRSRAYASSLSSTRVETKSAAARPFPRCAIGFLKGLKNLVRSVSSKVLTADESGGMTFPVYLPTARPAGHKIPPFNDTFQLRRSLPRVILQHLHRSFWIDVICSQILEYCSMKAWTAADVFFPLPQWRTVMGRR